MVKELPPTENGEPGNLGEQDKPHSLVPYGKDESPRGGDIRGVQGDRLKTALQAFDKLIVEKREREDKERRAKLAKEITEPVGRSAKKEDKPTTPQKAAYTDSSKKPITSEDLQRGVRKIGNEITSTAHDIKDDLITQLGNATKRLATRTDKSKTALEKQPQVFRDEGLLPYTVYVNNPKEGKTRKKKELKTQEYFRPVYDIPFAFAATMVLDHTQPIESDINQARLQLMKKWILDSFGKGITLADTVEDADIYVKAVMDTRSYYHREFLERVTSLKKILSEKKEWREFNLGKVASVKISNDINIPSELLETLKTLHENIASFRKQVVEQAEIFRYPPTLLPIFVNGGLGNPDIVTAMAYFESHLGYISVNPNEFSQFQKRVESLSTLPLHLQIDQLLVYYPLKKKYHGDPRILPPLPEMPLPNPAADDLNNYKDTNIHSLRYFVGFLPIEIQQVLYQRYKHIFEAFGMTQPPQHNEELAIDFLVSPPLTTSKFLDESVINKYIDSAARLSEYYSSIIPLLVFNYIRAYPEGAIASSDRTLSSLVNWFKTEGVGFLWLEDGITRTRDDVFDKLYNLDIGDPLDYIYDLPQLINVLLRYEKGGWSGDSDLFAMTRVIHPEYSYDTRQQYHTFTWHLYNGLISEGYLIPNEETFSGHYFKPDLPKFVSVKDIARLVGVDDEGRMTELATHLSRLSYPYSHHVDLYQRWNRQPDKEIQQHTIKRYLPSDKFKAAAVTSLKTGKMTRDQAAMLSLPSFLMPLTTSEYVIGENKESQLMEITQTNYCAENLNIVEAFLADANRIARNNFSNTGRFSKERVDREINVLTERADRLRMARQAKTEHDFKLWHAEDEASFSEWERLQNKIDRLLRDHLIRLEKKESLGADYQSFIRPFLSSLTVMIIADPNDKLVAQNISALDEKQFSYALGKDADGNRVITARSKAVGQLLNFIKELDSTAGKAEDNSVFYDQLLERVQKVVEEYENTILEQGRVISSSDLLVEQEVESAFITVRSGEKNVEITAPKELVTEQIQSTEEVISTTRPNTLAEWQEIFARYNLEQLEALRDVIRT